MEKHKSVIVVEHDVWTQLIGVVLDPSTSQERLTAFTPEATATMQADPWKSRPYLIERAVEKAGRTAAVIAVPPA